MSTTRKSWKSWKFSNFVSQFSIHFRCCVFSRFLPPQDLRASFYNFYLWILLFVFLFIAFSAFFNEPRQLSFLLFTHSQIGPNNFPHFLKQYTPTPRNTEQRERFFFNVSARSVLCFLKAISLMWFMIL